MSQGSRGPVDLCFTPGPGSCPSRVSCPGQPVPLNPDLRQPGGEMEEASACEDLACFADYLETLTCTWGSRRAIANLTGSWHCELGGTCAFGPAAAGNATRRRWTCPAKQTLCIGDDQRFRVEAAIGGPEPGDAPLRRCWKEFSFHDHVKPSPPFNLTAAASPDGYNLSWETRYRPQDFLGGELQYELGYRRRGHPWPEPSQKRLPQDTRTLQLLPQELEAGAEYELRVRARPRESSLYRGTWSDWSPRATLETLPKTSGAGEARWLLLLLSLFPALLAVLGWHQRLWKKLDWFVPSPAPFFQPLFLVHKGDFKKWVGTSSAGAVLDVSEWGAVVPEVCQKIGIKYLLPLPSPPKGGSGWRDGQAAVPTAVLPSSQLIPADSHSEDEQEEATTSEQPYGHLSIDTVMVAGGLAHCCPECGSAGLCCASEQWQEKENPAVVAAEGDAYCGFRPEGTNSSPGSGHFFPGAEGTPLPCCSASPVESPLWEAAPALVQAGGFLGRRVVDEGEPFGLYPAPCQTLWVGTPLGLSLPRAEEAPFCRELLSPEMDAEGNPGNGLDLDTIDSGFADCECGSPVDTECQGRQAGCGSVGAEEEKEAFLASYVKQWVSCHQQKA